MSMRELGWQVAGADTSEAAVTACREQGLDVKVGTFPMPSLPDAGFDVVTLRHSLEHVPNPRAVVAEAYRILRPARQIVITVPLCDGLESRWFGEDWFDLDLPRHLNHFTRETLARLLRELGFVDVRVRGERRWRVWRRSFARRFESRGRTLDKWAAQSKILARLLEFLSIIVGRPNIGIFTARKPSGSASSGAI